MNPTLPSRALAQQVVVSKSSVLKTLNKDSKMHPYKIALVHQIKETDYRRRVRYCEWLETHVTNEGDDILDNTFWSDDAWFHLSGFVNRQNCRIWHIENPHAFHERPLHSEKIGVWCAMSRSKIIGPIFFNETVTADRYQHQILMPFLELLDQNQINTATTWFQQDGATAHTARTSLRFLEDIYEDRVISKGIWPARSPDLTPLDFFLWGYLKGRVYKNNPQTIDELKAAITLEIQGILQITLHKTFENMMKRARKCQEVNGGPFQIFM